MRWYKEYDKSFFRHYGYANCIECDRSFRYIACLIKHQKKHYEAELRENRNT